MKIGLVNNQFSSGPGGQHRIQNLGRGFSSLGNNVTYISPTGASNNLLELQARSRIASGNYIDSYVNEFFKIFRLLYHLNDRLDLLLIELPNTMSKSLNGIYGLTKNIPICFDYGGLWTSFLDYGKTYVGTQLQLKLARPISQLLEDFLAFFSSFVPDLVTVPTTGMLTLFKKLFRCEPHLVYQPVDTTFGFNPYLVSHSELQRSLPSKYRDSRFVALGVKGDEWFIPLLDSLVQESKEKNYVFLVIGNFPKAQRLCEKKNLTNHVYFTGNVPYHLLPPYISLVDFAVVLSNPALSSLWYAPHNIAKIADYMAMGKPIVTDTFAASDYVENGKTGFLVGGSQNLVDKALCLLDDENMVREMGKNARDFACQNFDNIRVAANYLGLLKQIQG